MKRLRVGVFMGGLSIEREVSFNSGRTICDHLDTSLYDVVPLFQTKENKLYILPWHFLHRGKISDFEHRLQKEAQNIVWDDLKTLVDFVYIAVHGRYAEDGTIQGFLEVLGIPYLGAKVLGSALGIDKIQQKKWLRAHGIAVAKDVHILPHEFEKNEDKVLNQLKNAGLSLPVIVKPNREGSSLGVSVVFKKEDLLPAIEHAMTIHTETLQPVLIEEKIEGMEYSCITLFDKNDEPLAMPPTELVPETGTHFHDYTQKYMPGRAQKFTPARVSEEVLKKIQETCLKATRILEFKTISRIDGFIKKDGTVVVIDPNSLSGMAPSSFLFNQAAEINMTHTDLINHLIEVELRHTNLQQPKREVFVEKRIRVAVLMGGDTNERETSLDSGRNICYKLAPHKYEAIPLFVDSKFELYPLTKKLLVHNSTREIEHDLNRKTKIKWSDLPSIADFVFIGLHGGRGENGSVQGMLEMLGLPYNGPGIMASALCIDKHKTNTFLKFQGFNVPSNKLLNKEEWITQKEKILKELLKNLQLPLIVKPPDDGCSSGVSKTTTEKETEHAIDQLFKKISRVLVEECITGMELTGGVIGNEKPQALPPSYAVAGKGILSIEEKFLPGAGENQTPAPLPKEALKLVQTTLESVFKAVECSGYSRIDCFYQNAQESPTQKERVVILEINTLPGLTPATCIFHQAAEVGIKPMDFIDLIVTFGLQRDQIALKKNPPQDDVFTKKCVKEKNKHSA